LVTNDDGSRSAGRRAASTAEPSRTLVGILRATIHPRTTSLPLLSAGMVPELPIMVVSIEETPTVLACASCEVTWRDRPGAPCWFCGEAGHVANPERLVLD